MTILDRIRELPINLNLDGHCNILPLPLVDLSVYSRVGNASLDLWIGFDATDLASPRTWFSYKRAFPSPKVTTRRKCLRRVGVLGLHVGFLAECWHLKPKAT